MLCKILMYDQYEKKILESWKCENVICNYSVCFVCLNFLL